MAKRRRKKQADPVSGLIGLGMVAAFLVTTSATGSVEAAVIVLILLFALFIGITIFIRMQRMERLRRSGIAEVDKMDGLRFERYLAQLYKFYGYQTEVTQGSGDFGVDLILRKPGVKIAVQAKRYKSKVGLEAVQQVQAGRAHYGTNEAWVVTNSHYTEQAVTLARSNGVRLIAREELIELMLKMNSPKRTAPASKGVASVPVPIDAASSVCEICGGMMQQRKSSKGAVLACSNFPQCKNVQAI